MATIKFDITDEALELAAIGLPDGETDQEKVENYLRQIIQERAGFSKTNQIIESNKSDIEAVKDDVVINKEDIKEGIK